MSKRAIAILVGMVALGLLAGCGDSDDGATGSEGEPVSKAVFVKEANEICKETGKKINEGANEAVEQGEGSEAEQLIGVITDVAVPLLETEIEELRALGIPTEGEEQVNAYLENLEEIVEGARNDPAKFGRTEDPYEKAQDHGDPYGLTRCPVA